jgi:sugar phosphate isomerase/epimerase
MTSKQNLTRRTFLAATAAGGLAAANNKIPVGLELYSVRDELKNDLMGTVRAVAKMGYSGVEFFSPYFEWTSEYAREIRKLLDDLNIKCYSTHNGARSFTAENLPKAIELNQIIRSQYIVMASAGKVANLDGWKSVAETLNRAAEKIKPLGMGVGFHNHQTEFMRVEGTRPMDVLAKETTKDVVLQLDVGTCLHAGADPVAWINSNPGRIRSMHLKDWSPDADKGYQVLFGEGSAPWKQIFDAAESKGGIEYYLIEQEGSRFPAMETAQRCLAEFRKIHG